MQGHPLLANRSIWRRFPTVRNARWHSGNVVLLGDAAHTAHFSVGSGTKLAMEDAIALAAALKVERSIPDALAELRGRPAAPGGEPPARGPGEPRVVRVGGALPRYRAAPVRLQPAHPKPPHHPREPEAARSGAGGAGGPLVRRAGRQAERAPRAGRSLPSTAVHALPAPRAGAAQQDRGVLDVPVPGGGRASERLAPGAPRAAGRSAAPDW